VDTYRRNAACSVACGVVYPPPNATTLPFVIVTTVVVVVVVVVVVSDVVNLLISRVQLLCLCSRKDPLLLLVYTS
jgi:hypothetical protein